MPPKDIYRELNEKRELGIAIEALMREEAVVNYYAGRGKKVISTDDAQTRSVLKMGKSEPAADVLVEMGPAQLIIAEVKGSNIDRALEQVRNTAKHASSQYPSIACKIYIRNRAPMTNEVDLRGGGFGFRALRIFQASFPGEWLLYEYGDGRKLSLVCAGTEPVSIIFGPHV